MGGAVAAGNRHSADAGAWALGEGGTCVDAALAATFAAFVAEGPLTGPAGGGFLLLSEPGEEPVVLDCFFAVPSEAAGEMDEIEIDFADASTQIFHVGESSVAVPGLVLGLAEAHERRGLLAWETLFTPALELARRPLETTPEQAFLHEILVPILQREEGGRRIYGVVGLIDTVDLVPTLLLLRDARADAVPLLLTQLADDLGAYRVEERTPLEGTFAGAMVRTTPPPSLGGAVVQAGLAELERSQLEPAGSAREARALARALGAAYGNAGMGARPTGTTHVSVVDSDGAAVGLSSTLGSGSGVFRHGFQLNNMLGEHDVIGWEPREPGTRLPSMMTPTLVLDAEGKPRLVAGSAGSVRLAGAILQVAAGIVGHGLPVAEAIARPRLHVDGDTIHVEGGWPDAVAAELAEDDHDVRLWAGRNLFFGGVSAVERRPNGTLGAAGDPRRGGHGVVVPMIEIRPADPADASQLIVLAAEVGREPGDWLLTTDAWRAVGDERRYLKAVRRHPDAAVLVATDGPALVGRLSLARDPHPSSAHVADLGLMVAASHRRQGVGRALLDAAVEWARRAGVRKLELHVFPWNEPAIRLYEGYGFEREGVRRGHYERNGGLVDALLMAYHLPPGEEFPPSRVL